ncbi:recombinase A [Nannocystis pusilla]|uniref:recombinase A n=1 Tax=Nannocystis pusilla TaxID=889268 RepID=UPI003BEFB2BB
MTVVALRGVEEEERTGDELAEGTASESTESVASPAPFVTLAAPGKLIEVSGGAAGARLTTAVALVRQAQLEGETTVWIQPAGGPLFPPDLADSGVDLDALIVIHIPEDRGPAGIARAAELLLRSGGYGLCVLDLSAPPPPRADASDKLPAGDRSVPEGMPVRTCPRGLHGSAWQARLAGLARVHGCRVVLLTRRSAQRDSLGPMVGLRLQPRRERRGAGLFAVRPDILKHKGAAPRLAASELRRGPWGLA